MVVLAIGFLLCADVGPQLVEGVPFVRQEENWCGPAALASVLAYYGVNHDQKSIAQAVYTQGLKGALITDLENYARGLGFQTKLGSGDLADITEALRNKRPAIVIVDLGFWVFTRPHYLVVTGITDKGVRAHTGYEPDRFFDRREFERIWARKGSVYLIVWQSSR